MLTLDDAARAGLAETAARRIWRSGADRVRFTAGREPGELTGNREAAGLPNPMINRSGTPLRALVGANPREARQTGTNGLTRQRR
ncbi:hypothetical protein V6U77_09345 [Micromonospora sp. CPCC 205546]|uniref:hypothetical protein n=1 Tax=Micromonospora sp. CPCC 205546 TaxID=3122397 RepID=UPI002FEE814D